MEPRPHSGGAKRVDSKADGPVFHPGRGAYTNPLSTDKTGSQEASTDERKGKHKTVCSPLAECRRGSPTSHFKVDHTVKANGLMVTSAYPGNRINLGLNLSPVVHS